MMNGFRMEMNSAREWYLVGTPYGGLCRYPHKPPYADKDIMPS